MSEKCLGPQLTVRGIMAEDRLGGDTNYGKEVGRF